MSFLSFNDDCVVVLIDGSRCAHLGLSAVVADIQHTCLACVIREAYAARIVVVVITNSYQTDDSEPAPGAPAPGASARPETP